MTPRFSWSGITIDCADPWRLAQFWAALLERPPGEHLPRWVQLGSHEDDLPVINFQPVPEPKTGKTRIHIDVTVDEMDSGIAAAVRLGGRPLGQRYDYDEGIVVVMADPEGNEFCLVEYFDKRAD